MKKEVSLQEAKTGDILRELIRRMPKTSIFPRNKNATSEQELMDIMERTAVKKLCSNFLSSFAWVENEESKRTWQVDFAEFQASQGKATKKDEAYRIKTIVEKELPQMKSFIADWSEFRAEFENLWKEYDIEIPNKDKNEEVLNPVEDKAYKASISSKGRKLFEQI